MNRDLQLVDCTLREGEQTAGVWFSVHEKLALVDQLGAAGIPLLDAGMPAVSEDERTFLRQATGRSNARIGASVRARAAEVQQAIDCGVDEIFTICPVSDLHRTERLGLTEDEMLKRIEELVIQTKKAARQCNIVAEDASRTNFKTLARAMEAALNAGADAIYLCDTVGCWTPSSVHELFTELVSVFGQQRLGCHCHNDYGMATANTIAAIEAGCFYPTATINGVGERAGNASLLEIAAATDQLLGMSTGLDLTSLAPISTVVERMTGFVVPQHQPLVGFNAFRHESGIHVDGLLKERRTYESITPELVGRSHDFVVGKHSGRALLKRFAQDHDWPDDDATIEAVLTAIKTRRPDWARESFDRVRNQIDAYNETCLGLPEGHLEALFASHCAEQLCKP